MGEFDTTQIPRSKRQQDRTSTNWPSHQSGNDFALQEQTRIHQSHRSSSYAKPTLS